MSRLSKVVELNDRTVIVNELTVRDVKALWKELRGVDIASAALWKELTGMAMPGIEKEISTIFSPELERIWDLAVQGLKLADMDNYTLSALEPVYDAFTEVNKSFFALANQVEAENLFVKTMRLALMNNLIARFADLSKEAIPEFSTTDTPSS